MYVGLTQFRFKLVFCLFIINKTLLYQHFITYKRAKNGSEAITPTTTPTYLGIVLFRFSSKI